MLVQGRFVYDKYDDDGRVHNVSEFSCYIDIVCLPRDLGRRRGKTADFRSRRYQTPCQFSMKSIVNCFTRYLRVSQVSICLISSNCSFIASLAGTSVMANEPNAELRIQ